MYNIQFEADGEVLAMNLDTGIIVSTISGITGVTADIKTVQTISNIGTFVTGGSVTGKTLTVRGKVLDGNTDAKQRLLDFFKPLRHMTMVFNTHKRSSVTSPYRKADVYVKASPTITQETHSVFQINLFMPVPFFEAATGEELSFSTSDNLTAQSAVILGDTPPMYELVFTAENDIMGFTLYDGTEESPFGNYLYIQGIKAPNGKIEAGDVVRVWCDAEGHIQATINDVPAIGIVYPNSTLWRLELGERLLTILAAGSWSASVKYAPLYSGVLNDDV